MKEQRQKDRFLLDELNKKTPNIESIQNLLANKASPNAEVFEFVPHYDGTRHCFSITAFGIAAARKHAACIKTLMDAKGDPCSCSYDPNTQHYSHPMEIADNTNDWPTIKALLKTNAYDKITERSIWHDKPPKTLSHENKEKIAQLKTKPNNKKLHAVITADTWEYAHEKKISTLLESNASPNYTDKDNFSLLAHAAARKKVDAVTLLLEYKADPHTIGPRPALQQHYYTQEELDQKLLYINLRPEHMHTYITHALLLCDANPNVTSDNGWTPLHRACDFRHTDAVKLLIEYKGNINARTKSGNSVAPKAIHKTTHELQLVLDAGAHVGTQELERASVNNWSAPLTLLLEHSTVKNIPPEEKAAFINTIYKKRHPQAMIDLLAKYGFKIDYDEKLHALITGPRWERDGCEQAGILLKCHNASPNYTDKDGFSLLAHAVARKHVDATSILLRCGASAEKMGPLPTLPPDTPIYYTQEELDSKITLSSTSNRTLHVLLLCNANPNVTNELGWTPLHRACEWNYPDTVKTLLAGKGDVHAKTKSGNSVLSKGIHSGGEVARILLEAGAQPGKKELKDAIESDFADVVSTFLAHDAHKNLTKKQKSDLLDYAHMYSHLDIADILDEHGFKSDESNE